MKRPASSAEPVAFAKRSLEDSLVRVGQSDWPPMQWTLRSLSEVACAHHTTTRSALAKFKSAQAAEISAAERPNPTLNVVPQISTSNNAGASPWAPGATFDFVIETANKRGLRVSAAKSASGAAALAWQAACWEARGRVRKALLELSASAARVKLLRASSDAQQATVSAMEKQAKEGAVAQPVLWQARQQMQQAMLQVRDAETKTAVARATLAEALGVPVTTLPERELDLLKASTRAVEVTKLQHDALRQRPDVLAALLEFTAADTAMKLEVAKQKPDLHLGPAYQWDQGQNKWSLGVGVTLPLFNNNEGAIAEAKAKREAASLAVEAAEAAASAALEKAVAAWQGAVAKRKTAAGLAEASKQRVESAQKLVKAGESDKLALLAADAERAAAELAELESLIEERMALGEIEDAAMTEVFP